MRKKYEEKYRKKLDEEPKSNAEGSAVNFERSTNGFKRLKCVLLNNPAIIAGCYFQQPLYSSSILTVPSYRYRSIYNLGIRTK